MRHTFDRVGRFLISLHKINDRPAALATLAGCIVVRAESLWNQGAIEYIAICDEFDEVAICDETPTYQAILTKHEDGSISRTWKRQ